MNFIEQKSGYRYEFVACRNIKKEKVGDYPILSMEIQRKKGMRYQQLRIMLRTILHTDNKKIKELIKNG